MFRPEQALDALTVPCPAFHCCVGMFIDVGFLQAFLKTQTRMESQCSIVQWQKKGLFAKFMTTFMLAMLLSVWFRAALKAPGCFWMFLHRLLFSLRMSLK